MLKKAVPNLKRWVSGYLVAVMTLMLVFNNSFAFSALAAETASGSNAEKEASASDAFKDSKVSLKNGTKEDVQFLIFSEQASYEPGETVCLDLYIKNNTDKVITDGLLKLGKAKGIEKDSVYFEDMTDVYEAMHRDDEKPEETEEGTSEEEAENKEDAATESKEEADTENSESAETESSLNVDEEVKDTATEAAETLIPTEDVAKTANDEVLGTDVAETEAETVNVEDKESTVTIEETEEKVEEGSVAVEDSEETTVDNKKTITENEEEDIDEGKTEETDEEDKEEEEDPERLSELEILPGKTAYINFYYTIDPEIEGMKDQKLDFSFNYVLEDEDGKQDKNTLRESFRYAVDALNLMTVTAGGEKGFVETGKEDEMLLEFDLGQMREMLEEAVEEEIDKMENADASAAEAKRASASDLLIKWDDESSDGAGSKKDPAVIKNLKCEVETFGLKLEKFKAVPVKDDDNFGTSLKCNFYVSRKTLPGTYYGRVNASYKIKGKSFHTVQGFQVVVKQETGELELVGKIGDSEIVMTGPVSSFPKADELSLKVSEVTQEQQEKVDEALQKKAEEEGNEIKQYKALDIKLIADGEETEPEGDVQVRFKNVELENADEKKEAEQEKAKEQSIVKKAVRKVMSLFGAKNDEEDAAAAAEVNEAEDTTAKGSEKAAGTDGDKKEDEGKEESEGTEGAAENGENIKVLHLDEDAVVANEMKSEVKENGDVVIDTDHFSIYIVVNVPDGALEVPVTIRHYAIVDQWEMWALKNGKENPITLGLDGKYYFIKLDSQGNPTKDSDGSFQVDGEVPDTVKLNVYEKYAKKNGDYKNTYLYPGTKTANKEDYNKVVTEIYEPDINVKLPNGAGTGITFELLLHDWSKVSKGGNYEIEKIKVTNSLYPGGQEFLETPELEKTIVNLAKDNNEIIIYYKPTSGTVRGDVEFHDYNVTIKGTNYGLDQGTYKQGILNPNEKHAESSYHKGIRSNRVGMNNESLASTTNRIGVGIASEAGNNSGIWHQYNNLSGNFNNISKSELKAININGQSRKIIDFGMSDPGLFDVKNLNSNNELLTTEWYDSTYQANGSRTGGTQVNDYIAKKYFDNYQLEFKRNGDTYILSSVYRPGSSKPVVDELYRLQYTGLKWKNPSSTAPDEPLYSNLFWPMDEISYGVAEKTRDPLFGAKTSANSSSGKDKYGFSTNDELRVEGKENKAHNWFFGMRYDFEFNIDGYIGPMNYYFRGDDDFWLYVDGTLVQDVNLGGIHSSQGAYVDLRRWMIQNNKSLSGTHTMSVFFMERGGTGSCCYMSFTLPRVTPIPPTKSVLTKVAVEKEWLDEGYEMRPSTILVQLKQDGIDFGDPVPLTEGNGWRYEWENLPQNKEVGGSGIHTYTVEEISNPPGYSKDSEIRERIENGIKIFTITNKRLWNIPVEKKWVGDTNLEQIDVQLWRRFEDIPENSVANSSIVSQSFNTEFESNGEYEDSNEENIIYENGEINDSDLNNDEFAENEDSSDNQNQENIANADEENFTFPTEEDNWELVETIALKKSENWKHTWMNMPLYEKDSTGTWKKVNYAIKELDADWLKPDKSPNGWYEVKYEGDYIHGFTITNTFVDKFAVNIPISKECIDLINGEEATFSFDIKEIKDNNIQFSDDGKVNSYSAEETPLQTISINVSGNEVTTEQGTIEYNNSDFLTLDGSKSLYYEIKETSGNSNFIYDTSSYIVEVVISKNDESKFIAEIGRVWKNKDIYSSEKDEFIKFTNRKITKLEVTKIVGNEGNTEVFFDFIAVITPKPGTKPFKLPDLNDSNQWYAQGDTSIIGSYEEISYDDTSGIITVPFKLQHGKKVIIPVPIGSTVTIKEDKDSHAGYNVSFNINGTDIVGDSVEISNIASDGSTSVNVTCTNTPGVVLPDTGGPGLLMMSRLGWMLLLLALLMAGMEIQFYGERRNRKTVNAQREDTKGFDPEDY